MPDDDLSNMNDVLLRGGGWPRGPGSYSDKFLRKVNALQAKELAAHEEAEGRKLFKKFLK